MASATGAQAYGVAGPDASLNDVLSSSNASLALVVPAIVVLILVLLGLMLRSLVAPWYLALTRAIGINGTTVTAAGIILAGAFVALGFAGGSGQTKELGFSIAFSVLLDTFFVRTLLVPSIAMLLGRWNWWPAPLSRPVPA